MGHLEKPTAIVGVINESRMTQDEGARKGVYLRKRDKILIKCFAVYLAQKTLPFRRRPLVMSFRTVNRQFTCEVLTTLVNENSIGCSTNRTE